MGARRRKAKHWRKYLVNNLLPPKFDLIKFELVINKIIDIALCKQTYPLDIYRNFHSGFNKVYFSGTESTFKYINIIQKLDDQNSILAEEDLKQQAFLFLLELWDFFRRKWQTIKGKSNSMVFYDFARVYLAKWMGRFVANQILHKSADILTIPDEYKYDLPDPTLFQMDLGWVTIKSKLGLFAYLTTKQKYLLYLRFNKELSIIEIANLIKQHPSSVEKEFSTINKIIAGEYNVASRY